MRSYEELLTECPSILIGDLIENLKGLTEIVEDSLNDDITPSRNKLRVLAASLSNISSQLSPIVNSVEKLERRPS